MIEIKQVPCDIYLGRSAGEELHSEIRKAKKSVRIVSPYLSPSLVSELIDLHHRQVEVELVTTDNIEDFKDRKNMFRLIQQVKITDKKLKAEKNTLIKRKFYSFIIACLLLIACLLTIPHEGNYVLLILAGVFFVRYYFTKEKLKTIDIYSYSYNALFPFTVFKTKYSHADGGAFIHSKVYIIDDRIAYLGSLNYTLSGGNDNHETRIRIDDVNAIEKLKEEIDYLCTKSYFPKREVHEWGRLLYEEKLKSN